MVELQAEIDEFFKLACSALEDEDDFLSSRMDAANRNHRFHEDHDQGFYEDYHRGVEILFETTLVYLVVRRLLGSSFPMEARWEDAYPGGRKQVDLVLRDQANRRVAIEFKKWTIDPATPLFEDARKLDGLEADRRILFVITREATGADPKDIPEGVEAEGFRVLRHHRFPTRFRAAKDGRHTWLLMLLERLSS